MGFVTVYILDKLLATTDGKDKTMKVIQYLAKVLIMARDRGVPFPSNTAWPRLLAFITNISTARKIIRLGHGITPLTDLLTFFTASPSQLTRLASPKTSITTRKQLLLGLITPVLSLVNDGLDDLICLAKVTNSTDKARIKRLTRLSDRVWFVSILLDLREAWEKTGALRRRVAEQQFCVNGAIEHLSPLPSPSFHTPSASLPLPSELQTEQRRERTVEDITHLQAQLSQTRDKLFMQELSLVKLAIDSLFCAYDVFDLEERGVPSDVQVVSGFVAGVIGLYKIYRKCE